MTHGFQVRTPVLFDVDTYPQVQHLQQASAQALAAAVHLHKKSVVRVYLALTIGQTHTKIYYAAPALGGVARGASPLRFERYHHHAPL